MAINASITRNGKLRKPAKGWGWFTLGYLTTVLETEHATPKEKHDAVAYAIMPSYNFRTGEYDAYRSLNLELTFRDCLRSYRMNNNLPYIVKEVHIFKDDVDGDIMALLPGDELSFWG